MKSLSSGGNAKLKSQNLLLTLILENFSLILSKLDSNHNSPPHSGHLCSIEVNSNFLLHSIQVRIRGFLIMK